MPEPGPVRPRSPHGAEQERSWAGGRSRKEGERKNKADFENIRSARARACSKKERGWPWAGSSSSHGGSPATRCRGPKSLYRKTETSEILNCRILLYLCMFGSVLHLPSFSLIPSMRERMKQTHLEHCPASLLDVKIKSML